MKKTTNNRRQAAAPRARAARPQPETAAAPEPAKEPPPADPMLPPLDPRPSDNGSKVFSVPVTNDGRIAWDQVKGKKRERLRTIVNDPTFTTEIGLNVGALNAGGEQLTAETAGMMYHGVSMMLVGMLQMRGVAPEHARLAAYRPEQIETLAPMTAKVLNKYVGQFAYTDEIMLVLALGMMTSANLAQMREAIESSQHAGPRSAPLPFDPPAAAGQ